MKKILLLTLFLTSSLLAELDWADSYEQGLAKAKKEHKIVMLMFSTKTCKMCNYMKSTAYDNEEVIEYVKNFFVPIEVDIQAHPVIKFLEHRPIIF